MPSVAGPAPPDATPSPTPCACCNRVSSRFPRSEKDAGQVLYFLTPLRRPTWKSGRTHCTPNWRQRWQRSSFWARPFSHLILDRRHTRQAAALRLFWSLGESRAPSVAGAATATLSDRSIWSASICAHPGAPMWLSAVRSPALFSCDVLRGVPGCCTRPSR
jgi:hypothetical protein